MKLRVSEYENDAVSPQEHFRNETILVDGFFALSFRRFCPHFFDVLEYLLSVVGVSGGREGGKGRKLPYWRVDRMLCNERVIYGYS